MLKVNKSIFLSSASVYANSQKKQTEKYNKDNIDYPADKFVLEECLIQLMEIKSAVHLNLRISNVYGNSLNYGFISSLSKAYKNDEVSSIFKDRKITRDYIFAADVIYAIENLFYLDLPQQNLNISTGIGTSIEEIIEIYLEVGGDSNFLREIPTPLHVKKNSVLDCNALRGYIHWEPLNIKDGLKKLFSF